MNDSVVHCAAVIKRLRKGNKGAGGGDGPC